MDLLKCRGAGKRDRDRMAQDAGGRVGGWGLGRDVGRGRLLFTPTPPHPTPDLAPNHFLEGNCRVPLPSVSEAQGCPPEVGGGEGTVVAWRDGPALAGEEAKGLVGED